MNVNELDLTTTEIDINLGEPSIEIELPGGARGLKGEKGDKGDTGSQGPKGDKGDKGDTGAQGPKGDTGSQGATGPQGETGPKGDTGEPGPGISSIEKTSTSGLVDTYTITYGDGETATFDVTNGEDGEQGPQGATGPQGPKGDTGAKGDTGSKGDTGATGPQGIQGVKGDSGTDGVSPIITTSKTGKTTTLTIVDADGTKTATILDGADGQGSGDMLTSVYDTNHSGVVDNAEAVNGHTVGVDVPSNAVFTDTTYTAGTGIDITNNVISSTQSSAEWGNITGTLSDQTDLASALGNKADTNSLPTKLSELTNDTGYITGYTETDPIFNASVAKTITSSDITNWNNKSTFSGSYNDLTDKPTIPTKVSELTNDSGYTTNTGTITKVQANGTDVASSGTANIPAATTSSYGVTTLSNSTSSVSTTVAATSKAVSDTYMYASGKQDSLISGTNIKTINGNSLLGSGDLKMGGDTLPIGSIVPYSGSTIPTNYLLADGSAVSRTAYSELFEVIGTTYGSGDGSTTFNLPNIKGKVPVGLDSNDTDFDTLGETGGEKTHTLTVDEIPNHNHTVGLVGRGSTTASGLNWQYGNTYGTYSGSEIAGRTGGGQAHNIMQPYIVQNYIIKAKMGSGTTGTITDMYSTSTTDAYSCNQVNEMNTYSETETRIGTWMGKPLYRKCFSTLGSNFPLNHGISNLKAIIKAEINATNNVNNNYPAGVRASVEFPIYIKNITNTQILAEVGYFDTWTVNTTLEYTKTTD